MNYVEKVRVCLEPQFDKDFPATLLHLYTLLGVVFGSSVDKEDVHNAWAVWMNLNYMDHPDLVPYDQLHPDCQELDERYADMIRKAVLDSQGVH